MRIAVVGGGISGLGAAYLLSTRHEVTLFERERRLGGHAHTHTIAHEGEPLALDSGFLVLNERTYPNLLRLFGELRVRLRPSDMSFGVRCRHCGLEYASRSITSIFAQRRRAVDPRHLGMLAAVVSFHRDARRFLQNGANPRLTLGEFLAARRYGSSFVRHFLLPMTGAIWSAAAEDIRSAPALTILRFLDNHGLLAVFGAPRWFTVAGGSQSYVRAIAARLGSAIRCGEPVVRVMRDAAGVTVQTEARQSRFDKVVLAAHADESVAMLADPSPAEASALGAFRYSRNVTVLHTDSGTMPAAASAWAAWNMDLADCRDERASVAITYHLNRLQALPHRTPFLVTLNPGAPVRGAVLAEMTYSHPVLDVAAIEAQPRVRALNGTRHTYYCGAHLRYGFHEDGLVSAIEVASALGVEW